MAINKINVQDYACRKWIFVEGFILILVSAVGQNKFCSTLIDAQSKLPIAYEEISSKHSQAVFLSNADGIMCVETAPKDTLQIFAFGYEILSIVAEDLPQKHYLTPKAELLHEVILVDCVQNAKKLKGAKRKIKYQEPIGDIVVKIVASSCDYQIDSLEIFVHEVMRETNFIEVVALNKNFELLDKSPPFSFKKHHEGKDVRVPTGFLRPFTDTTLIGIRFLEEGINGIYFKSKLYQYRKDGHYVKENNGITIGGYLLEYKGVPKYYSRTVLGGKELGYGIYREKRKPTFNIYYRSNCKLQD